MEAGTVTLSSAALSRLAIGLWGTAFSTKRRFKQKYRSTWVSHSAILHGYRRKCWNLINLMNAKQRQHSQGLKACGLLLSANLTFCLELMSITAKRLCEQ